MGLFSRKRKDTSDNADTRVYAFVGLGMMARFMTGEQLEELMEAMPARIARECGASPDNVVVVQGGDWAPKGKEYANSVNFDGTPAYPDAAQALCEAYLKKRGIYKHVVGDKQLLGVLEKGGVSFGTYDDLKADEIKVNGTSIIFSAWLAFHQSALKA